MRTGRGDSQKDLEKKVKNKRRLGNGVFSLSD